jgi:RNA polymerase sigma factor (sigma-70 family)
MELRPEEYSLALRAKQGDRQALVDLVEHMRLHLFALAFAELRHYDDAHDAVAAAFVQIFSHIEELRQPERVLAWMQSIVRNEARRLRHPKYSSLHLEDIDVWADQTTATVLRIDIERALRQLPQSQEKVLRLFYLAEQSVREIAQETGNSESVVKMWLHRGRKRLAIDMKGYESMTTVSQQSEKQTTAPDLAIILHSDLESEVIHKLAVGLEVGGYAVQTLTPEDLGDLNQRAITLIDRIKSSRLVVLDEFIGGRPALEYILNIKADSVAKEIPMVLLYSVNPDFFSGSAFFTAGVDSLLDKQRPDQETRFRNFFLTFHNREERSWNSFTEAARRAIRFAQEEAVRWQENQVSTEHLLLGILRDNLTTEKPNLAVRILAERFDLPAEQLRAETERHLQPGTGGNDPEMQLTGRSKQVIDLTYDESRLLGNNFIGTEHLLLALLRTKEGMAGKVLTSMGLELQSMRLAVHEYQNR